MLDYWVKHFSFNFHTDIPLFLFKIKAHYIAYQFTGFYMMRKLVFNGYKSEVYSKPYQTSKIEDFEKIVNG